MNYVRRQLAQCASRISSLCFPFTPKARKMKEELALLASYSSETVYRLRYQSMTYDYISPAVTKLLGYSVEEMQHVNFRSLITEMRMVSEDMRRVESFEEFEKKRIEGASEKWQADYLLRMKDGRKRWVSDISYPWYDSRGEIIGSVGSLSDIHERVEAEARMRQEVAKIAGTDTLTGLPNRMVFFDQMTAELMRMKSSSAQATILLIDVNNFRRLNERYGELLCDHLLINIAEVIGSCLRSSDVLARTAGDEFGVLLPETSQEGAYWVAQRIASDVANYEFYVEGCIHAIEVSVSIGEAATEEAQEDITAEELYKQADTKLYLAKSLGQEPMASSQPAFQLH